MMTILLISVVVFFLTLWRREYGVGAIVLLLPSYLLRTSIFGVPTTALETSIYALTVACVISTISKREFSWPYIPRPAMYLLVLWILAWIIATAFSTDHQASLGAFKAWLIDPLLVAGVMLIAIRTKAQVAIILRALATSGIIVAVAGIIQMFFYSETLQDGRLSSFFAPVANYAAMYLGPIIVLTVGGVLWKNLGRRWWAGVIIMSIALALTVSFGGYLAVGVGLLFFLWRWPNKKTRLMVFGAGVVAATLGLFILAQTPYLAEKFNTTDRSSSLVRTQIWRTSWQMIIEHPFVGIGPNAFESVYRATIPKLYFPPLEWLVSQPHQLYLALWLETGLLGLVTFLVFIAWWMKSLWTRIKQADGLAISAVAAMLAILVHGLVDTPYFKNDLSVLFVLIATLPLLKLKLKTN